MKGTMTTMMVLAYAATAGAEDFVGSRWVRTQGIRTPSHQSAFVATPAAGTSTASRGIQSTSGFEERSHAKGFFANTKSRNSLTRVSASEDDSGSQVDLKVDSASDEFSCQNAYFFAEMCEAAYSNREEVKTIFQGNETVTGMGFEHFKWFEAPKKASERSMFDAVEDTEAFVAANDDVVMAVFRGTMELTDWTTNLDFLPTRVPESWGLTGEGCDVHSGFNDGVDTVWHGDNGMLAAIKALCEEEGKNRKLYISGHSLGGALATIAGARLAFEHDMKIAGIYTIGSPRVFDGQLSEIFDNKDNHGTALKDKYFRCRNNNDIVPRMVPPPYCHVGTEIYLDRFGAVATTSWTDRLLGRLSSYLRLSFIDGINDHSGSEYVRLFKQLVVNSKMSFLDKAKSVVKDAAQKVVPVNTKKAKIQEAEIEAAKQAAFEASKEAYHPTNLPDYPTEL